MRKYIDRYRFFLFFAGIMMFCFTACSQDDLTISNSGNAIVYFDTESGTKQINLETNSFWSVALDAEAQKFITIKSDASGTGNAAIEVYHTQNNSFNRMGKMFIHVSGDQIVDTVFLKQYGNAAIIEFMEKSDSVLSFAESPVLDFITNVPVSKANQLSAEVEYSGTQKDWISNFTFSGDLKKLSFSISENPGSSARSANVNIVFTDGWGERTVTSCLVNQSRRGGTSASAEVSFEQVKALIAASSGSLTITSDLVLSGYVISDCQNGNVAGNPNTSQTTVDYDVNYRTAYVQDVAANDGFALVMENKGINVLSRYNHLKLWLKGLTLVKESNPERYTLKGIIGDNFISITAGKASDLPLKAKYIGELADRDLYTFVTLKDCEFPIRKGSFTPVNEGYTSSYSVTRVDKYPLLMRDINGNSCFVYTNIACPYRRNGSVLPQGSGNVSGIVVYETYERFEGNGILGKYQIRHLTREDIDIKQKATDGFSNIICEWSKFQGSASLVTPTTGSGELTSTLTGNMYGTMDFSYPGPIVGNITLDNKGVNPSAEAKGIAKTNWSTSESWVMKCSTQGLSGSQLSMQLATFNNTPGAPRYWTVEYSTNGTLSGPWATVANYTVPDIASWDNTLLTQLSGWKNINVPLPLSLLAQSTVYIRLRPRDNKAGTSSTYDGGTINTSAANTISYLSIRYNK